MSTMQNDPWTVFNYEVEMFFLTRSEIPAHLPPQSTADQVIRNALVESSLLHTRILADILLCRGSAPDDIHLTHLLASGESSPRLATSIALLKSAWGDRNAEGSVCWTINKMLAHPTLWRTDRYDYGSVANRVDPHITAAIEEIASLSNRPQLLTYQ